MVCQSSYFIPISTMAPNSSDKMNTKLSIYCFLSFSVLRAIHHQLLLEDCKQCLALLSMTGQPECFSDMRHPTIVVIINITNQSEYCHNCHHLHLTISQANKCFQTLNWGSSHWCHALNCSSKMLGRILLRLEPDWNGVYHPVCFGQEWHYFIVRKNMLFNGNSFWCLALLFRANSDFWTDKHVTIENGKWKWNNAKQKCAFIALDQCFHFLLFLRIWKSSTSECLYLKLDWSLQKVAPGSVSQDCRSFEAIFKLKQPFLLISICFGTPRTTLNSHSRISECFKITLLLCKHCQCECHWHNVI